MLNPYVPRVGGVLSADIAVPDHEQEVAFYSNVLTTGKTPLWRDDLMNHLGTPVIGLGKRIPEYEILPVQWMPHFQVADVLATIAKAVDMGANVLMKSETDDVKSQWAAFVDPSGAAFGVIPVVSKHSSVGQNQRSGCIAGLSLTVADANASCEFYQRLFDWTSQPVKTPDQEGNPTVFEMQFDDKTTAAEICQAADEPDAIPAVWLLHLPVADLAESLRRVKAGGGEIIKDFSNRGYAIVRDPVGVCLALRQG